MDEHVVTGNAAIAMSVHELLRKRGETVAVAESLTGGQLAASLVEAPGASETFRGGLIVYATDLKTSLAGVPASLLAERGPVDLDIAAHLAAGARTRCGSDWGVATTGVAGPDPQGGKEPGTVFVAVSGPDSSDAYPLVLRGSRDQITGATVTAALRLLHEALDRNI
ncbi:MAG: nicotinamide-nucleotide amidase [Cryptosporangiaceae bacterium]|jgi:nicotinamide-nucleotide amidase|nr:nicotinamide-nucleotide amidase [Cryptosporangiaceae bacterium]